MKKAAEKGFLYLIPLLFTFPLFKESISSFFFILLSANAILYSILSKNYKTANWKRALLLGIPFWIIAFTGLLRGSLPLYERHLNHALFFLLFPIIFELVPKKHFTREKLGLYFSILKNACLVVCLGYIAAFFYYHSPAEFFQSSYNVSAFRNFVYLEIGFFKMHPTYFSAILFFCIALCFDRVLRQKKFYELVYIAVFTLLTFLLLVRINTVFIVLMIPGMILFRSGLRKRTKTLSIAFFSLVLIGFIAFTPGIQNRFTEFYDNYNRPPEGMYFNSSNIRIAIFKCSKSIAEDNYLWGVGFENLQTKLNECFSSNYNSNFYKSGYLTHNYFSYIFLGAGILGLLALLYYVFFVVGILRRIHSFVLYLAMSNIFVICFTEDYFYRHFGLFYFSLLLLSFMKFSETEESLSVENTGLEADTHA